MKKYTSFEKLFIREGARDLYIALHTHFEKTNNNNSSFAEQILEGALAISTHIAQGCDRPTVKGLLKYLYTAKGFAAQVKSMLFIGEAIGYFTKEKREELFSQTDKISGGIYKLIQSQQEKYAEKTDTEEVTA